MKKRLFYFVIALFCWGCLFSTKTSAKVSGISFQLISEEDSKPIPNRDIYVFNGDYEIHYEAPYNPYPYDDSARKEDWYITKVTTDGQGKFSLDISKTKVRNIYFQAGSPYRIMDIEKSSDISHSPSDSHIRIVRFEKGTTKVKCNDIYDLNIGIIKKIWLDGKNEEVTFKDVTLIAQNEVIKH
jgi:hypothetical protein